MTIEQTLITPQKFQDFWESFKGEPQQVSAVWILFEHLKQADPGLLAETAEWIEKFRERPPAPLDYPNTWDGVKAAAQACGAKFPELVAAQWSLESAHGTAVSGRNNFFGIKGSGSSHVTQEEVNGQMVTITAGFIDFPTLKDCVAYLVSRWYCDFKGYQGVNHCANAEAAAYDLKRQGYATDSAYPEKLIRIMHEHA
jgi:Mannosyl-glycoprotein endo-beta-N-acetylglucosaminidase